MLARLAQNQIKRAGGCVAARAAARAARAYSGWPLPRIAIPAQTAHTPALLSRRKFSLARSVRIARTPILIVFRI